MVLSALERAVLSKRYARRPLAGILFPALGHGGGKQQLLSPAGAGDLRTWREGRPAGVRFAVKASPILFQRPRAGRSMRNGSETYRVPAMFTLTSTTIRRLTPCRMRWNCLPCCTLTRDREGLGNLAVGGQALLGDLACGGRLGNGAARFRQVAAVAEPAVAQIGAELHEGMVDFG